jgi:peptide/nickel transport system ATP-binding protein/oligopeptide transport system ATP-binding protein
VGAVSATLSARAIRVEAPGPAGPAALVDGVDLEVPAGSTLALVGESGSGKTLTALALLRVVPPPARVAGGRVLLDGRDLMALGEREMRRVRGGVIGLVPQSPAAALDPVRRVGWQIAETLRAHARMSRARAGALAAEALAEVGLTRDDHPHRLSGGQRQRAMLALALAPGPALLVADEPTSALDPAVQVEVLDLLRRRRDERGLTVLLVSHDLGAVGRLADRVAVMYAGRIVEEGPAVALLTRPRHPYAIGLVASAPRIDAPPGARRRAVPGAPPRPAARPPGCAFAPRCPARRAECEAARPPLREVGDGRRVACVLTEAEAAELRGAAAP